MPIKMLQGGGKKPKWKARVGEIVTVYLDPLTSTGPYGQVKLVRRRRSPLDISGLELWRVEAVRTYKYPDFACGGHHYIKGKG